MSKSEFFESFENGVYKYELTVESRHAIVTTADGRFLVDTGSPLTMRVEDRPIHLCGETFDPSRINIMDTVNELSGLKVDGLLGLDVLSNFNVLMDYKEGFMKLSRDEAFRIPGQEVPMHILPLKSAIVFKGTLNGEPAKFILDSGAKIDYVTSSHRVEGLESVGEADDFYPGAPGDGHFKTRLYDMTLGLGGDVNIPIQCGLLPDSLSKLSGFIAMMGVDAIVGYSVASRSVAINFREKSLIIG